MQVLPSEATHENKHHCIPRVSCHTLNPSHCPFACTLLGLLAVTAELLINDYLGTIPQRLGYVLTSGATCASKHFAAPIWSTGASLALLISRIFDSWCIQLAGSHLSCLKAVPFSPSYSTFTRALLGLRGEGGKVSCPGPVLFCLTLRTTEVPDLVPFSVKQMML